MIRIVLIRHGRTNWNVAGDNASLHGERFRGTLDVPLADEGVTQSEVTAQRLARIPLAAIYASPLRRAARTAAILAAPHNIQVDTLPGLSSMNYGDWTGRSHDDVASEWPDLYRAWRRDPFSIRIPGGESATELRDRARDAVYGLIARHGSGDTVVIVTHQMVTKILLCTLMGMPDAAYWILRQDLCNISVLSTPPHPSSAAHPHPFNLHALNDTCHFSPTLPAEGDASGHKPTGVRLLVVRHGQTGWNAGAGPERFRGRSDLPLDATGLIQAQAVRARLASEPVRAIYSSPLLRTRQTVAPLAELTGLPIVPHPGLLDIDYGGFQGLDHDEAASAYPETYALWRKHPSQVTFPHGEGLRHVQERLRSLLSELAAAHAGETVVLASHQMVNKVLACTLLGLELDQIWHIDQATAAINVYQQAGSAWQVLRLNDTCHIQGATV
ncbi:MAG: histidine phosphatase family protein [Anaerolineae bacterium]|nr:histidine phosphatase family protein [Anaerolineae bacterium]